MRKLVFTIFLFLSLFSYAQEKSKEIQVLESRKKKLESEIAVRQDSLKLVIKKIEILTNESMLKVKPEGLVFEAIVTSAGKIRKADNPNSIVLTEVKASDTVFLTGYSEGYWVVNKGRYFGYIHELYIKVSPELGKFKDRVIYRQRILNEKAAEEERKREAAKRLAEYNKADAEYRKTREQQRSQLIQRFGKEIGEKLFNGNYWIGMTTEMARASLGNPENINKSVGVWGVNEQWVYSRLYLYFEDGIMTSYQTSR